MIEVRNLKKQYGAFEALRGVSFEVARGEVVGLLGPNGAGKTTTMKILTGYLLASSGEARVAGLDVATQSLEVRRRIGYLPENAPLYQDMLVRDYLGFCAEVRGISRADRRQRYTALASQCAIADVMTVPIGHLSKGYRQRVGLAQALLHEPELMILDEPTSGLDPNQIVEIRGLLREIGRTKTIILSTHILAEVEATCDRVLIIHRGEVVADAAPDALKQRRTVFVRGKGASAPEALEAFGAIEGLAECTPVEGGPAGFALRLRANAKSRDDDLGAEAYECARARGWTLNEIRPEQDSLESVFHELTGV
ncbi:MAG: ABC transporter ATP-binding protein [Planctomycetota bacterium]|jgi:ABC-2 type transport system ATP-binding protein